MKRSITVSLALTWVLLASIAARAELAFRITPVEDPSTHTTLYVSGFNNRGEIVGSVETTGTRAFIWKNGVYQDLGAVIDPNASFTEAVDINDRSVIAGNRFDSVMRSFLLKDGRRTDILAAPAGVSEVVLALNNRNQVIGNTGQKRAFIWHNGSTTFLENLPGTPADLGSMLASITDRGVVAGTSGAIDQRHAVIWKSGTVMDLGVLPGTTVSQANDINIWEQVVGESHGPGGTRAFLWQNGALEELPALHPDQTSSIAWSVNDWGVIAGETVHGSNQFVATLWMADRAFDLNTLIADSDPLQGQVTLNQAWRINDRGQIVARGTSTGATTATMFLLTPVR